MAVGQVEDHRAVGRDPDATVAGHLHDRGDPARRAAGHDHQVEVAVAQGVERIAGAPADGAVGQEEGAIEIGGEEPDSGGHRDRW